MSDCIFCKIAEGSADTELLHEDEAVVAFADINPKAPVHLLIVPRKHIASINEVTAEDRELLGKMILAAQKIARQKGLARRGYRLIYNVGAHGGQIVPHIHLHLLGGRKL